MLVNKSKKKRTYQKMMQDSNMSTFNDDNHRHFTKKFKYPRKGSGDDDVDMSNCLWGNTISTQAQVKDTIMSHSYYQAQTQTPSKAILAEKMKCEMQKYRGEIAKINNVLSYCPCAKIDDSNYC